MLDSTPVLDESLLALGRWIARYYLAPLGEVYRTMLPLAAEFKQVIAYRITELGTEALYESASELVPRKRSHLDPERQMAEYAVLDYLAEGELVREATLRAATGASREMLRNLVAKKWIAREDLSAARDARRTDQDSPMLLQRACKLDARQAEPQPAEDRGAFCAPPKAGCRWRNSATLGSQDNADHAGASEEWSRLLEEPAAVPSRR